MPSGSAPAFQPQSGSTHTVLVAAANSHIRLLITITLGDARYRIHEEETEDETVVQAQISRPALAVIDADLTQGSGIRACQRIKSHPLTRDTVVILISGWLDPRFRARAEGAGADAVLYKPFSPAELAQLARTICGLSDGSARDDRGSA